MSQLKLVNKFGNLNRINTIQITKLIYLVICSITALKLKVLLLV